MTGNGSKREAHLERRPDLLFHSKHGKWMKREEGGRRVVRNDSSQGGIVFSNRTIAMGERVCIRLASISTECSGLLRVGLSCFGPSAHNQSVLRQLGNITEDFDGSDGYWIKTLPDWGASQGDIVQLVVSAYGDMHYSINGEPKGILLSDVTVNDPWFMVNVCGIVMAIEFVNPGETGDPIPSSSFSRSLTINQTRPSANEGHPSSSATCSCMEDCSICMEAPVNAVIYTCGHMIMCYECAVKVKKSGKGCPICRKPMKDVIKTFKS